MFLEASITMTEASYHLQSYYHQNTEYREETIQTMAFKRESGSHF